jgi:lysophospholipase L1-like esterase
MSSQSSQDPQPGGKPPASGGAGRPRSRARAYVRVVVFLIYTVAFCLVAGEIVVRVMYSRFSDYNMEMWRYASGLKQPLDTERLPFHHYPNRHGRYYGVEIRTNSMGLRDREYALEKPAGKRRIVVIGDSFTLGWGVPFDSIFSKRLEALLNQNGDRYEVINLGVGNYNTTMEVELFKWKGLPLRPDMAVLVYFINDVEPVPKRKPVLEYAAIRRSYFAAFLFDRFVRLRSRFVKSFSWSSYYRRLYSDANAANLAANRQSLEELVRLCRESGIRLLVVNLPEMHQFSPYPFAYATDYISGLAAANGVPFLDMLPALKDYDPSSLWVSREDHHANAKADSIIARGIYDEMLREGLP